jgi:hypothetical protein
MAIDGQAADMDYKYTAGADATGDAAKAKKRDATYWLAEKKFARDAETFDLFHQTKQEASLVAMEALEWWPKPWEVNILIQNDTTGLSSLVEEVELWGDKHNELESDDVYQKWAKQAIQNYKLKLYKQRKKERWFGHKLKHFWAELFQSDTKEKDWKKFSAEMDKVLAANDDFRAAYFWYSLGPLINKWFEGDGSNSITTPAGYEKFKKYFSMTLGRMNMWPRAIGLNLSFKEFAGDTYMKDEFDYLKKIILYVYKWDQKKLEELCMLYSGKSWFTDFWGKTNKAQKDMWTINGKPPTPEYVKNELTQQLEKDAFVNNQWPIKMIDIINKLGSLLKKK